MDHFDFVKKLLDNRQMIYYCTRLKQADAKERSDIESEMAATPDLKPILDQLQEVDAGDIVAVRENTVYGIVALSLSGLPAPIAYYSCQLPASLARVPVSLNPWESAT